LPRTDIILPADAEVFLNDLAHTNSNMATEIRELISDPIALAEVAGTTIGVEALEGLSYDEVAEVISETLTPPSSLSRTC
jgi:hypothetical protein